MNVFILNTGRCGSTSFIKASRHITNYTSGHESRAGFVGDAHFKYPENHIEADNRLSWFLGRLDKAYGNDAIYVHLKRNPTDTARSFTKRYEQKKTIIRGYREFLLIGCPKDADPTEVSLDYCDTVNSNIEAFLKDKTRKMVFSLENAKEDFRHFWSLVDAEGDLPAALAEWEVSYNATRQNPLVEPPLPVRTTKKIGRIVAGLPAFLRKA